MVCVTHGCNKRIDKSPYLTNKRKAIWKYGFVGWVHVIFCQYMWHPPLSSARSCFFVLVFNDDLQFNFYIYSSLLLPLAFHTIRREAVPVYILPDHNFGRQAGGGDTAKYEPITVELQVSPLRKPWLFVFTKFV